MGYYVNAEDSKEDWLANNSVNMFSVRPDKHRDADDNIVVAYGRYPTHSFAGICYCQQELEAFDHATAYFMVPIEKLAPFIDVEHIE